MRIGAEVGALAVHAGRVYWTQFEALVASCAIAGCDTSLRKLWSAGFSPVATGVAVDDSGVYWATAATDSIRRCALDGCANNPLVLDPDDSISAALRPIALDHDNVYFADGNPSGFGMVLTCPKSGCGVGNPTILADGLSSPNSLASDGVNVYWAEDGAVRKCSVAGCGNSPTTIAMPSNPRSVAVDQSFVYWLDNGGTAGDGRVMMAPK